MAYIVAADAHPAPVQRWWLPGPPRRWRDWSLSLTLIDIAWGIFVSAAGAVAGALAYRALRG